VSFIAVALACLRNAVEAMASSATVDGVRFVAAVCIGCACCFGISGIVVGWPIRGFMFGLLAGAAAVFAFFIFAQLAFVS
jgi:hypothetical protein